jgi:hypothetical protein
LEFKAFNVKPRCGKLAKIDGDRASGCPEEYELSGFGENIIMCKEFNKAVRHIPKAVHLF